MRRTFLTGALAGQSVFHAEIGGSKEVSHESSIRSVVEALIAGFRKGDVEDAFSYVSPVIRGAFGAPQHFALMVQQGYPMIWYPGEMKFLELRNLHGLPVQDLVISDARGAAWTLGFEMMRVKNEGWRVNGVEILQTPRYRM